MSNGITQYFDRYTSPGAKIPATHKPTRPKTMRRCIWWHPRHEPVHSWTRPDGPDWFIYTYWGRP